VRVRVPAKINLALSVGPPRDDGFHSLATVFQAVSLYDEVVVAENQAREAPVRIGTAREGKTQTLAEADSSDRATPTLRVSGQGISGIPLDSRNLAWRAVEAFADRLGREPNVSIGIAKAIPVAGGMAGGSADAAAALLACSKLWGEGTPDDLQAVASEIGSDVPFALMGGTCVGVGRGEILTEAMVRGSYEWVFALSEQGLSTPAVYRRCDELRGPEFASPPEVADDVMLALRTGDSVALGRALSNDLQPAAIALMPHLQDLLEVGVEHGALGGIVSGSGPTCGFLVAGVDEAVDLGVALSASGLCSAVRRAEGPVSGATVIESS
jgi:4-diphosphocytidyl-2-C-methyl-D-erythritol kinase